MPKIVIVTGANGNLGKAVVNKFLKNGDRVLGAVRKKSDKSVDVANLYEESILDLLNAEDCEKYIEKTIDKYQEIDVAVLTSGGFVMGNLKGTSTTDIFQQYRLNFETAYNIIRPLFLKMIQQNNGRIFLVGSRQGLDISQGKGAIGYALSKSLIFRLAELLNAEAKGINVIVTVIVPSVIDTPENRESMPDEDFSDWVTPEKIAEVIHFYSSEAASDIKEPILKMYGNA